MVHVPLRFLSEWREFPWIQFASRCCWNRASPYVLPFGLCDNKRLPIRHFNRPLFQRIYQVRSTTREVGRAEDLSASSRTYYCNVIRIINFVCACILPKLHCAWQWNINSCLPLWLNSECCFWSIEERMLSLKTVKICTDSGQGLRTGTRRSSTK